MIKLFLSFSLLFLSFFSADAFAIRSFLFKPNQSNSLAEFHATGVPGFIHIDGEKAKVQPNQLKIISDDRQTKITGEFIVNLNEFQTGIEKRDEHMKKKYIETDKYPNAILTIDEINIEKTWPASLKIDLPFQGKLSLHGVTKQIGLPTDAKPAILHLTVDNETVEADATFSIIISDFNINIPKFFGISMAQEVLIKAHLSGVVELSK